jgi:hypothetical protein
MISAIYVSLLNQLSWLIDEDQARSALVHLDPFVRIQHRADEGAAIAVETFYRRFQRIDIR